jgi:hypothetical protein
LAATIRAPAGHGRAAPFGWRDTPPLSVRAGIPRIRSAIPSAGVMRL